MPRQTTVNTLATVIENLRQQRQVALEVLTTIDATLARFGIAPDEPKRRGRKPSRKAALLGTAPKQRRKRGHFDQTASEFVLGLLKNKSLTTKEVNAAWAKTGRGGRADTTLMTLTKTKAIKRQKVKDGAGSEYSLA